MKMFLIENEWKTPVWVNCIHFLLKIFIYDKMDFRLFLFSCEEIVFVLWIMVVFIMDRVRVFVRRVALILKCYFDHDVEYLEDLSTESLIGD